MCINNNYDKDQPPRGVQYHPDRSPAPRAPHGARFFSDDDQQIFIEGQRFLNADGGIVRRIAEHGDLYITLDGRELEINLRGLDGVWESGNEDRTDLAFLFIDGSEEKYEYIISVGVDHWGSYENFYNEIYDIDGNPLIDNYRRQG